MSESISSQGALSAPKKMRDIRLDFFRGLGMFIILIAHIPFNTWTLWIPARFGFSDATEIFVFCSGAASALAFLSVYSKKGWWLGTARILWRIWQIYWCHIGVFLFIAALLVVVDNALDNHRAYESMLNLRPFFNNPHSQLIGLLTLTYVPNFFDILVMYIVILALIPVVAGLARFSPIAAMGFSVCLYLASSQPWIAFIDVSVIEIFNLPAEPWTNRSWYFNPFAWQLVFFTGFAFSAGWLPKPPIHTGLMIAACLVLIISAFLDPDGAPARRLLRSWDGFSGLRAEIQAFWSWSGALTSKSFFGLLRYVHFLALAYVVWALAGDHGRRLPSSGWGGQAVLVVRRVGQQSLAVFICSLVIAQLLGIFINELGRGDLLVIGAANLIGFVLIIAVAYSARFWRSQPWLDRR